MYWGPYHSPDSEARYFESMGYWRRTGEIPDHLRIRSSKLHPTTRVRDVVSLCLREAPIRCCKDGKPTSHAGNVMYVMRELEDFCGDMLASEFGPRKLRAFRDHLLHPGTRSRRTVNDYVSIVVTCWRWATEHELVEAGNWQALRSLSRLKAGRTDARESSGIQPVDVADVRSTQQALPPTLRAMIDVQMLTGMRPGEVVIMRRSDLERDGDRMVYRPTRHKTQHHDRARVIYLPALAVEVLRPFVEACERDGSEYLFAPARANRERQMKQGQRRGQGEHYTTASYRRAIRRAAEQVGVDAWHPNQLRHTFATAAKHEAGWEAARAMLGHSSATTTQVYVERDRGIATMSIDRVAEKLVAREGE